MSLKKISITLDSGILGLQKYGGISNYWNRLIENMNPHPGFETTLLLPKTIINNTGNVLSANKDDSYKTHKIKNCKPQVAYVENNLYK